jgi:hypothetical protein
MNPESFNDFCKFAYQTKDYFMNLKEIMAIGGKPGLYKVVTHARNGIIVESIIDQKRLQAFASDKVSTLEEISIYTESGDMPLREVLQTIYRKLEGKPAPDNKGDNNKTKQFFAEMLPEYDKDRVYVSHMQKIISWYNLLIEHNLIDLEDDKAGTPENEENPGPESTEKEQPEKGKKAKPEDSEAGEAEK